MTYYLYKITVGGKSYIGTAAKHRLRKRWYDHARAKSPVGRAIRKFGLNHTAFKVIGERRVVRAIYALERVAIARRRTRVPRGYNVSKHGNGPNHGAPKYRAAYLAGIKRRSRNSKWLVNSRAAVERRSRDPRWLAGMVKVGKRNSHSPKWRASHAAAAQRRRGKCTPAHAATMRRIGLAKRGKPWSVARRAAGQPHWSAARRAAQPKHYAQRTFT